MEGTDSTTSRLHPSAVKFSQTGLRLRPGMAYGAWRTMGLRLCELNSASGWWLGDWILYGEHTYGKRYAEALEVAPLSYQTLRNYAWVARRFPMSRRRDTLSFQHHAEVAALPDAERDLWLQRAERLGWTRNELRRRLAAARAAEHAGAAPTEIVRIELDGDRQDQWRRAAAAAEQPLVDWLCAVVDAAAACAPAPVRTDRFAA